MTHDTVCCTLNLAAVSPGWWPRFKNLAWSLNASYQHTALWKQLNPTNHSVCHCLSMGASHEPVLHIGRPSRFL